jgi:hypothetical protein
MSGGALAFAREIDRRDKAEPLHHAVFQHRPGSGHAVYVALGRSFGARMHPNLSSRGGRPPRLGKWPVEASERPCAIYPFGSDAGSHKATLLKRHTR